MPTCRVCRDGKQFKNLGPHLRLAHKMTPAQYEARIRKAAPDAQPQPQQQETAQETARKPVQSEHQAHANGQTVDLQARATEFIALWIEYPELGDIVREQVQQRTSQLSQQLRTLESLAAVTATAGAAA